MRYLLIDNSKENVVWDQGALTYFAQVVTNGGSPLSLDWKIRLNTWFKKARLHGNLDKYVRLHFWHNEHTIAARTSLVNPSQPMADLASSSATVPVFMVFNGISTSALFTSYIDTKFTPSTDGGSLFILNSAFEGFGITGNADALQCDMGGRDASNGDSIFSAFGGSAYNKLNSIFSGNGLVVSNSSSLDANYCLKRSSGTLTFYKNNTPTSGSDSATALMTVKHFLGAFNNQGTPQNYKTANYTWHGYGSESIDVAAHNADIDECFTNKSCILYGNSITFGSDGTTFHVNDTNWASLLCRAKGWTEDNRAVNSTTLLNAVPVDAVAAPNLWSIRTTIPTYDASKHASLSLNHSVNDCGLTFANYTVATYSSQYNDILTEAITNKGWPSSKVVVETGTYVNSASWSDYLAVMGVTVPADNTRYGQFRAAAAAAGNAFNCVVIDPYAYLQNANNTSSIFQLGVHLNTWGNSNMFDYYLSQIAAII